VELHVAVGVVAAAAGASTLMPAVVSAPFAIMNAPSSTPIAPTATNTTQTLLTSPAAVAPVPVNAPMPATPTMTVGRTPGAAVPCMSSCILSRVICHYDFGSFCFRQSTFISSIFVYFLCFQCIVCFAVHGLATPTSQARGLMSQPMSVDDDTDDVEVSAPFTHK
jgi:hypothetical protein